MKNYNTLAELRWVFMECGEISLTTALRLLNEKVNDAVDREYFKVVIEALLESKYIEKTNDNLYKLVRR